LGRAFARPFFLVIDGSLRLYEDLSPVRFAMDDQEAFDVCFLRWSLVKIRIVNGQFLRRMIFSLLTLVGNKAFYV